MTKKVETEKDSNGNTQTHTTEYTYNAFNKVEEIKEIVGAGEPAYTTFTYDEKGNLTGTKDAEGNTVSHKYDDAGRKTWTKQHFKNGTAIVTEYTYYPNDLLKTIKDDKGNVTTYEYDDQKRVKKITYPDASYLEYTYTEKLVDGKKYRVTIEKQRNGIVVTNNYDQLNRLVKRGISAVEGVGGATFEDYDYDALSRMTKAVNDFSTVEMKYDFLNRLIEDRQNGKLVNYTYSVVNNLRKMTMQYPNQRIVEKDFDILDRISRIKQGQEAIADFSYIGRSYRMLSQQFGNGNAVSYLYDQGRRLNTKETKNKNSDLINKYIYGYNKVGMKMFEQRGHNGNKGDAFNYDEVYRLTGVKFNSPEPQNPATTLFERKKALAFDDLSNTMSIVENQDNQTKTITTNIPEGSNYSKLNQYERFDQWGLSYDLNGNTTQRGTQHITYDYRNQVVSITDPDKTINWNYDPLGRRIQQVVTSGSQTDTTNYYYSGNQVIEERDGSDNVLRQFVYGNGIDEFIRMDKYNGTTAIPYYYQTNAIGSVTAVTDADGNVVESVDYDIYGMPTFQDAAGNVIPKSSIGNNILFQGREYDEESNLYYYRARYYDPIMGRFLQPDPMGYSDSMNLYQGFNMNPVNFMDPMGKRLYIGGDKGKVMGWLNDIIRNSGTLDNQEYIQADYVPGSMKYDQSRAFEYISPLCGMNEITYRIKPQIDINLNAGAWLINELINSDKVYLLGAGNIYPTSASMFTQIGKAQGVGTVINLDWQNDSRIDRYRPNGKLPNELPPTGIDSVVWFGDDIINNVAKNNVLYVDTLTGDPSNITLTAGDFFFIVFHELLESYFEVELGLQYNDSDSNFYPFGSVTGAFGSHRFSMFIEQKFLRPQRVDREYWNLTGGWPRLKENPKNKR